MLDYTLLINQTAIHSLPAVISGMNSALLRGATGGSITLTRHPLPVLPNERAQQVSQETGDTAKLLWTCAMLHSRQVSPLQHPIRSWQELSADSALFLVVGSLHEPTRMMLCRQHAAGVTNDHGHSFPVSFLCGVLGAGAGQQVQACADGVWGAPHCILGFCVLVGPHQLRHFCSRQVQLFHTQHTHSCSSFTFAECIVGLNPTALWILVYLWDSSTILLLRQANAAFSHTVYAQLFQLHIC